MVGALRQGFKGGFRNLVKMKVFSESNGWTKKKCQEIQDLATFFGTPVTMSEDIQGEDISK